MSNESLPFQRSQSADFAPQPNRIGLLMSHSSGTLPSMTSSGSFQRRTFENARQLRESFNTAIRQIEQPVVETARNVQQHAMTISSFLNRPRSDTNIATENNDDHQVVNVGANSNINNVNNSANYVAINLDGAVDSIEAITENLHNHAALHLNNDINNQANNNNNNGADNDITNPFETHQVLQAILKYVPFLLILLAKSMYDYHEGIFILIILFTTFAHANNSVKREALKRARRSIWQLCIELIYICSCTIFINYVFSDENHYFNLFLNLVLIRTFTQTLTVWNLLWLVTVTDFMLKLITVTLKILLTMMPGRIVPFKKRGKIYLFIEALSQLYRSIATIQPWLFYLLESYQGAEKIVAVFLSAFYMISKGSDLMFKVKLLKTASFKLIQSVTIGSSPSKEEIQTAGDNCPICHDTYDGPVLLQCRHIFCESCVSTWFDREQTCPLCRAKIVDDPSWRDGSTSYFIQLF